MEKYLTFSFLDPSKGKVVVELAPEDCDLNETMEFCIYDGHLAFLYNSDRSFPRVRDDLSTAKPGDYKIKQITFKPNIPAMVVTDSEDGIALITGFSVEIYLFAASLVSMQKSYVEMVESEEQNYFLTIPIGKC